jgi:hypothetical protein
MRLPEFARTAKQEVPDRVHAGKSHVGILFQIELTVKERVERAFPAESVHPGVRSRKVFPDLESSSLDTSPEHTRHRRLGLSSEDSIPPQLCPGPPE